MNAPTMPQASVATRIGPNAITRVAEALDRALGRQSTLALFERAMLRHYLDAPPEGMVDEAEVGRLHARLHTDLGDEMAVRISRDAGVATAEYLLARRIPGPVQVMLRHLPAALACRILLAAITRHAWTFAGSGRFDARAVGLRGALLTLRDNPMCRGRRGETPICDYYATVFEHLFRVLVHSRTRCTELTCEASGGDACRFELAW